MEAVVEGLNSAQRAAVTCSSDVLQILAPPGSGKTKTLTARVAALLRQDIEPWRIIVCTFTVKAAKEMAERIEKMVDHEKSSKLRMGTFHSIALRYLRQHHQWAQLDDKVGVADTSDTKAILKRIIKLRDFSLDLNIAAARISTQKSKGIELGQYVQQLKKPAEQHEFTQIWHEYQQALKTSNLLDYDDILLRCVSLLRMHPECVSGVDTVFVDEFQDTNSLQYELMCLFAQKKNRVTIVGDPDQSIYGWRSAEIKNLISMRERWPSTITINLEDNYRSTAAILRAAQALIEQDDTRPLKTLQATLALGLTPVLRQLPTAKDEADWVAQEMTRMESLTGNMLERRDFAVLVRSAALSRHIEAAFGRHGISYRMVGGMKFFERLEIKIVLDYLRVIDQPAHSEAVVRIVNVPSRRIGDKTIDNLRNEAQQNNVTMWSLLVSISQHNRRLGIEITNPVQKGITHFVRLIKNAQKKLAADDMAVPDLITYVVKSIDLPRYLKEKHGDNHEGRMANVEELIAQAAEASTMPMNIKQAAESQSTAESDPPSQAESGLTAFLANVSLTSAADDKKAEETEQKSIVTISTIHAAKGLEWPVVFIPACYEGSIPHSRSENNDEERRLLYVGMTRAAVMLYLSRPVEDSRKQTTIMSSFLEREMKEHFTARGPSIAIADVRSLSKVLRRDEPTEAVIRKACASLERDKDDYWPADGSEPVMTDLTVDHVPVNRPSGFTSVASQYEALMRNQKSRSEHDHAKRHQADKETSEPSSAASFLRGYLTRPKGHAPEGCSASTERAELRSQATTTSRKLVSVSSNQYQSYTVRSETLNMNKKRKIEPADASYSFMSSSPTKPEHDKENDNGSIINKDANPIDAAHMKPANTFHKTSMHLQHSGRKVLGIRRTMHGWSDRGKKS